MYKITLVNMPFAAADTPSLALTQLKSIVDEQMSDQVTTSIIYPNQDMAKEIGLDLYQRIASDGEYHNTGFGEWFFRQAAFPEQPDNTAQYLSRYYPVPTQEKIVIKQLIEEKRPRLESFLRELIDKYELDKSDLVGFSSMFFQNTPSFAMARLLKQMVPNIVIVMGGANCETPMGQEIVKNVPYVNYVFSGPSLKTFPAFVRHHLEHEGRKCDLMNGVFSRHNCTLRQSRDATGTYMYTNSVGLELNIDETPINLDYRSFLDILKTNFPDGGVEPRLFFETSRGCWWGERSHCTFCGLNGSFMNYRSMDAQRAINYFHSLFQFAGECFRFDCVDNILPKSYFTDVLPFINPPDNVSLFYEVKADLSDEQVARLAQAKVNFIQPGIESLATSTLKLMRKGTSACQNIRLLKSCVKHRVFPYWNLLIGFPNEREDVYKKYAKDIPLITHLIPPTGVFPVRFDRYSPYFMEAERYGLLLYPFDFYAFTFPFSDESLKNMAYYFIDDNFAAEYQIITARWIGKLQDQFSRWQNLWYGDDPQKVHPRLFMKNQDDAVWICDSRTGRL
ncbi:MAG TPA: RiPP maturation radical SAM C-methyltransferase, partial [Ktedonobacteraceae bacterium]